MSDQHAHVSFTAPVEYTVPSFPSLYWPPTGQNHRNDLYDVYHIWLFTMCWTVILFFGVYGSAGLWAVWVFRHKSRAAILSPVILSSLACLGAFISGSIIGLCLGLIYTAGHYSMSTWVPFLWAIIQALVSIMGAYSTMTSIL
ncbi:MAG: hypothetical protein DHS80DRAFT_19768 [Piptocephalis tieghemiana]|nr:MAG: hypothetical protein DHS80DRAFT_19768 [Piptocephalis tieghemiana]